MIAGRSADCSRRVLNIPREDTAPPAARSVPLRSRHRDRSHPPARPAVNFILHALLLLLPPQSAPAPPTAEVKASFLKLLDRPRIPLDAKRDSTVGEDGLI